MLRKLLTAAFVLSLVAPGWALAQDTGTIQGVVTDSTAGASIPGANVVIRSISMGAATGADGSYEISSVPAGEYSVTASFVGYVAKSQEVAVEAGETVTLDFALAPQTVEMGDVVVTALGVERDRRSVGASVQQVTGEELAQVENENFVSSLAGRVSGASIKTSSTMGGSANITLRGFNSLTGDNQPLIVIDGIPIDNSTQRTDVGQERGFGGFDYGNAASIINPNNIQSLSVLKGPAAAALYGSRGANGVIQITTKSGEDSDGLGVSFSSGVQVQRAYQFMDYQNSYGGGAAGSTFRTLQGNDFVLDGSSDQYVADYATDESWGPRLDGRNVRQWYSWDDVNDLNGVATPWEAHPDNVKDFLQTGTRYSNDLAVSDGAESYNYRLYMGNVNMKGVMPNSEMDRYRFGVNGTVDVSESLTANAVAEYNYQEAQGRSGTGYGFAENAFAQFNTFGQRQLDLGPDSYMRDYLRPGRQQRGWNWAGVQGAQQGTFQYTDNPYVGRYENLQTDDSQRFFGKAQLNYDIAEGIGSSFMVTNDHRTERRGERVSLVSSEQSSYTEDVIEAQEINTELKFDYETQFANDFDLDAFVAGRIRWETFERNRQATSNGLAAPQLYTVENSVGRPEITDYFQQNAVYSSYGSVNVGYNDLVYMTGTLRNDWSSTLPEDNNSYLYPSIQTSFVFSSLEALEDQDVLSYGKLRASWARVGDDTGPYQLDVVYPVEIPYAGQSIQRVDRVLNNANLEPEITTGVEVGLDLEFFNNRASLATTYYRDVTRNQILSTDVSPASGFGGTVVNAGEVLNTGVEAQLGVTPVRTEEVNWDINVNWALNNNEIVELAEGINTYVIGDGVFAPPTVAQVGESYGTVFGSSFIRDANGQIVYNRSGVPVASGESKSLGSFLPDWTAGASTNLSYKGASLSVLVEGQKGGKIWSLSNAFGTYSGLLQETVEGNQRETGVIPSGVVLPSGVDRADAATTEGIPFGEAVGRISAAGFWKNQFFGPLGDNFLYDASYIKLQEVVLAYNFPSRWFANTPIQRLNVAVTGRNLAILYKKAPNIDPSLTMSTGNFQGFEAGQIPPQRQLGMRFNLTF
ncbi:SusC/RagA family TonB-linked outer membrane protein [Longibacter salinarum]|uniref:SusC/RagA family TonB-linked outer membrane protein n=1 Tax=Longibacter salinarum TaxID=1850348 RepID=A0A2A8D162_9BACT|nr:SusC/RagA family TonB-linked outer membrane protein [Longibacter salinarum]PEN14543.1 SusC/RagA family TonB-linked outer membrane protein [Longibacter salinarum]